MLLGLFAAIIEKQRNDMLTKNEASNFNIIIFQLLLVSFEHLSAIRFSVSLTLSETQRLWKQPGGAHETPEKIWSRRVRVPFRWRDVGEECGKVYDYRHARELSWGGSALSSAHKEILRSWAAFELHAAGSSRLARLAHRRDIVSAAAYDPT